MALGRVFPNEIDRLFNAPGGPIGREARQLALQVANNAATLTRQKLGKNPNDKPRTGKLARSWTVKVAGRSTEFEVANTAGYSAAIEKGARPHAIRARRVSHLRFKGRDGRWRTVKMVRHPGNAAYRLLETAAVVSVRQRYGTAQVR